MLFVKKLQWEELSPAMSRPEQIKLPVSFDFDLLLFKSRLSGILSLLTFNGVFQLLPDGVTAVFTVQ